MNNGITKKFSSALYGIAILLMLYHHLFCVPDRLNGEHFHLLGAQAELVVAWFCKICVAIYAFISGYGMCCTFEKESFAELTVLSSIKKSYSIILKRILKFMKKYWIVFAIFVPIGYLLGVNRGKGLGCLGLTFIGCWASYNGEWWYVRQYLMMLLIFPIVYWVISNLFCNKKYSKIVGILLMLFVGIACIWLVKPKSKLAYLIIFSEGALCSKIKILETDVGKYSNNAYVYISILLLVICFAVRSILSTSASYYLSDIIIAPIFIYAVCIILSQANKICDLLEKLGKYSVYMWLTHTFYCYYYF